MSNLPVCHELPLLPWGTSVSGLRALAPSYESDMWLGVLGVLG